MRRAINLNPPIPNSNPLCHFLVYLDPTFIFIIHSEPISDALSLNRQLVVTKHSSLPIIIFLYSKLVERAMTKRRHVIRTTHVTDRK